MKIEIWNEEQKEEEQPLRLRLVPMRGGVELQAVDEVGQKVSQGHLLFISSNGQLSLAECISEKLGLKLDDDRALEVSK